MELKSSNKRALTAAKTKKKILEAAADLFIKNGFEGVSISQIAKKAEINQSLIYHYFQSKEELWKSVKRSYVDAYVTKEKCNFDLNKGLKHLIKQLVYSRFEFYEQNPDIVRMMSWQRLESEENKLAGDTFFSPEKWKELFMNFQLKREIKKEIDLDMMILFIMSLVAGALKEDYKEILRDPKKKSVYLDLIISSCMRSFSD